MTTKHKDDKGEFEYVEVAIVTNPVEALYKKVYTQKQIDWSEVDSTVLVYVDSVTPSRFHPDEWPSNIRLGQLRFDTDYLYANPGHCPLPEGVVVEVVLRMGSTGKGPADRFHWEIEDRDIDIITYRITGLADEWKY